MRYLASFVRGTDETLASGTDTTTTTTPSTTNAAQAAPSTLPAIVPVAVKPAGKPRRILNTKPAVAAKPATPAAKAVKPSAKIKAAKPSEIKAAKPAVAVISGERADARAAARLAVSAYYAGRSLPFKAACDLPRKADLNPSLQSQPTERTAALIGAIIAYCELSPSGEFVRGSGRVPGKLLGRTGSDGEKLFAAGPESGCLSNMLGQQIIHVRGPLGGKQAAETVLRLTDKAISNLIAENVSNGDGKPKRFTAVLAIARKTLDLAKFPSLNTNGKPASGVSA